MNKSNAVFIMLFLFAAAPAGIALSEITVGDPSFEEQSLSEWGPGNGNSVEPPWVGVGGGWVAREGLYGLFNFPDGSICASTSNDAFYQDLSATYEDGVGYTLTAMGAARSAGTSQGALDAWQIALHNATTETELAATTGAFDLIDCTEGPEAWVEISVNYTATAADDGNPIRIYFGTGFAPNGSNNYRFILDDVHLAATTVTGVLISQSNEATLVSEAGISDSYTIALSSEPTANVTITAAPGDGEIDIGNGAGSAKTLVFTTSDWNTAQTVTVTAFDDTVYEGGPGGTPHITTINHSALQSGGGGEYDGISVSTVEVSVIDDELGCGDWGYLATDFNQDCYVDLADFAYFALHYLDDFYQLYYDPVCYWKFDDGSGTAAADSSGNGRVGALINFPGDNSQWVTGQINGALEFDRDDYVEVAGYKGVTGLTSRTVAAWINTDTTGEIVTWGTNSAGAKWIFRVQDTNGTAGAIRVEVNGGYIVGSTDVRDNDWHHVAAVLEDYGSRDVSEIKLYVDGVEEASYSAVLSEPVNTASGADVKIGVFSGSDRYFTGQIDDVRIYSRGLSGGEILELAN